MCCDGIDRLPLKFLPMDLCSKVSLGVGNECVGDNSDVAQFEVIELERRTCEARLGS